MTISRNPVLILKGEEQVVGSSETDVAMPFLNVKIPHGLPVGKETIIWQVDWRRALGSEDQIMRLQKATGAVSDFGGKGGFELKNDIGVVLNLEMTPVELNLEKHGTIKLTLHAKRPPPLQIIRESITEEAIWKPKAISELLETSGRIPDWRDRIRKRSDPTQSTFIETKELDPHFGLLSLNKDHKYNDVLGTELGTADRKLTTLETQNNYYLEKISRRPPVSHTPDNQMNNVTDMPSCQVVSLDHVPGFQLGDMVEAIAVEQDLSLNGRHGTVVGCEMVGMILHVEIDFGVLGKRLVMTKYLQNLTEIGIADPAD